MNFNNFTIKSQEAVQQAVNVTQARGQQAIEPDVYKRQVLRRPILQLMPNLFTK